MLATENLSLPFRIRLNSHSFLRNFTCANDGDFMQKDNEDNDEIHYPIFATQFSQRN